jgi:hypothetical protein
MIVTKLVLILIGLWVLSLLLLFIFPGLLPPLSGFAILISMPIALVLFILALIALIKDRTIIQSPSIMFTVF